MMSETTITNPTTTANVVDPTLDKKNSWRTRMHYGWNKVFTHHDPYWKPYDIQSTTQINRCMMDFPRRDNYTILSMVSAHILNWLVIIILGVCYAIMASVANHPHRVFRLDDPDLQYPTVPDIISNAVATVLDVAVPLVIIVVFQLFVRNIYDIYHALLGFATAFVIQGFIKSFVWVVLGGLRPDFLTLCNPDPSRIVAGQTYYSVTEICRNIPSDLTPGFPSGHASQAFCGWVFLLLYLNAKWKPFDNRSHVWKIVLVWLGCWLVPIFVASTRIRDFSHTPGQVWVGIFIGIVTALIGYRTAYCSLFGIDNHIPTRYVWTRRKNSIRETLLPTTIGQYTEAYQAMSSNARKNQRVDTELENQPHEIIASQV
jgi:diacylglycerol diphosphate phosphatase/phosphatidate phosphatase